ncbi:MAG: shikimate dehydrogenase [Thioalkalispiraceae bacterium]|jgi:shikimate dehydrogenase
MSDLFDFGERVERYAVMGNPINHSKSPMIHTMFAQQTNQSIEYTAIHVDLGGFAQAVGNFRASGGKGLNITVPFKEEAWALATDRSERAERAGAVNTLKFIDERILGDNTDGVGLVTDLVVNHQYELIGKRLLLLGAGGAARGVLAPLADQAPAEIIVGNRTPDRAVALAKHFSDMGKISGCGFPALQGQQFDIVINATAASLQGEVPPLPNDLLNDNAFCYDMMYGAQPTAFMNWATNHGAAKISDGLGMLVEQAAESFFIWRGVRPETQAVIQAIRSELNR